MNRRQTKGAETIARLSAWDRSHTAAERLAGQLLRAEDFQSIDPSHPLGGPDGLKDVLCIKEGKRWIGAAYFPRGQQSWGEIRGKFLDDLRGVAANAADGIAFVTNQELRLAEREELEKAGAPSKVHLVHLEWAASLLDSPACYGIRLEFLDIEMTKEEQVAFIAEWDQVLENLQRAFEGLTEKIQALLGAGTTTDAGVTVPLEEIKQFKAILDSISGTNPFGISYYTSPSLGSTEGHMRALRVPIDELRQFAQLLDQITGSARLVYGSPLTLGGGAHVSRLHVPLDQLKEYEATLDRIIAKQRMLPAPYHATLPFPVHEIRTRRHSQAAGQNLAL